MLKFTLKLFVASLLSKIILSAPIQTEERKSKSLSYFDYIQPDLEYNYEELNDYDSIGSNEISRTIPKRKRIKPRPTYDSPIYYIRLPPQPYMFVPGLGYVSRPPPPPVTQFVNLPLNFVSNGKPSGIYQWSGGMNHFPPQPALPLPQVEVTNDVSRPIDRPIGNRPYEPQTPSYVSKPQKHTDSKIHRLPGQYSFNGKPNDIFVLRDSYNSLYSDVLQNLYP